MSYKVVIPQDITDAGKNFLIERGYELVIGNGSTEPDYLKELVADADAILARTCTYPGEVLAAAKNLKVIGRHGVGYDNVDVAYCGEHNIPITITPEATSNAVAERTLGFILSISNQIPYMNEQIRKGNWNVRNTRKGSEIYGKTLGLIGLGRIGSLVARKAFYGLGMSVLIYDEYLTANEIPAFVKRVHSAEEVFRNADYVSLHVPSTPETRGMVNSHNLSLMKPNAAVINCSRGDIVVEEDLVDALSNGTIKAAALDVYAEEPPRSNHPFFGLENIILTPHNSTLTDETMDLMGLHAAQGIDDVLSGRPPKWPVKYPNLASRGQ